SYGVHPLLTPAIESTDRMLALVEETLLTRGCLKTGDGVVVMAGQPVAHPGSTNLLKLHRVGEGQNRKTSA
ncbi:MAG: pyruvate kinase alpha/beta domain-containing protein, partial [Candidatus Binataceae bacterium]